jgi:hypothetical protein
MQVIVFKLSLVLMTALCGSWLSRSSHLMTCSERRFVSFSVFIGLVLVLTTFVGLHFVGHWQVTSDVPGYYVPAGEAVLAGRIPYRDFGLSYAPLFPYIAAGLLRVWNSGEVFVLFDVPLSALSPVLWYWAATVHYERTVARQATIQYVTSGHVLIQTLLGTNQIWIAMALGASALLMVRSNVVGSGLVQALAACTTKILTLLFWPVLWICAPARPRWLVAALPVSALLYGGFGLAGADVLDPIHRESARISSGNVPYLLGAVLGGAGHTSSALIDALSAAVLGATLIWFYLQVRPLPAQQRTRLLLPGLTLIGLVFMVASKKSFTAYAVFFMFPAILAVTLAVPRLRRRAVVLFVLNALLALEPTLYFHYIKAGGADVHAPGTAGFTAFLLVDFVLLGGYVYLAYLSGVWIRTASSDQRTTISSIRAAVSSVDQRELTTRAASPMRRN